MSFVGFIFFALSFHNTDKGQKHGPCAQKELDFCFWLADLFHCLFVYKFVWLARFSPLRTTPEQTDDAKLFHLTAVMVFLGVHIVSVVIIVLLRGMRIL